MEETERHVRASEAARCIEQAHFLARLRSSSVPRISSVSECSYRSRSAPDTRAIFSFVLPFLPSTKAASSLEIFKTSTSGMALE